MTSHLFSGPTDRWGEMWRTRPVPMVPIQERLFREFEVGGLVDELEADRHQPEG